MGCWRRVLRFVIARGGGHGHVWPVIRCSGVMGWRVGNQRPRLWRTSHLGGVDGRASAS